VGGATKDGLNLNKESLPKFLNSGFETTKSTISLPVTAVTDTPGGSPPSLSKMVYSIESHTSSSANELDSSDDELPELQDESDISSDCSDSSSDSESDGSVGDKGDDILFMDSEMPVKPLGEVSDLAESFDPPVELDMTHGCVFTLEDGSLHTLKDIFSTAGARAITVKGKFRGKPINILFDTGSDIVCVSSHAMSGRRSMVCKCGDSTVAL
jgi:hypothetical protein